MRRILAAVLMTTLVIAACGGDGGGGGTAPTVAMTDFLYEPADVTVPAGAAITLDLQNRGSLEHQWVILEAGVEVTSEDELPEESEIFAWESTYWGQQLGAGQGATFTFTAPAAGTYQIVCAIPGHHTAGMVGELTVTG